MTPPDIVREDIETLCGRLDFSGLSGATVLITGASGLIGGYLMGCLAHLRRHGLNIRVIGVVRTDYPPHWAKVCGKEVETLTLDLAQSVSHQKLPVADAIIHAAGYAQPLVFMANPRATYHVNASGTEALKSRLTPGGRFLFVSSSEIYSGLQKPVLTEEDIGSSTPYHPRAAYIEGKRAGEFLCHVYRDEGIAAKSVRLGHIYGPGTRQSDRRALNGFIEQAIRLGRIELLDAGRAIRTYCYVADAIESMWHVFLNGTRELYNVGGTSRVTIAELALMVAEQTGATLKTAGAGNEIAGAPEDARLDLSRIGSEFHKTRFVALEEGLRRTIAWQRELYATG